MSSRLIKQFLYGLAYAAVLISFLFGVYYLFFKKPPTCFDGRQNQGEEDVDCGGPCPSCEIRTLSPLVSAKAFVLPAGRDAVSAVAEVRNPNLNYGAESFDYEFVVSGPFGEKSSSLKGKSFIYAAESKYLLEAPVAMNIRDIASVEVFLSNFSWKSRRDFPQPMISFREINHRFSDDRISVEGVIVSGETIRLPRVFAGAILYGKNGDPLSVARTELRDVAAFQERFFKITFPAGINLPDVDQKSTKIFIEAKKN